MSAVTLGNFAGFSAPVRRSGASRSRLRMTTRGRSVLLTLIAAPLVVAALVFGINAGGATATNSSTPLAKVTVVGGETLWSLAKQIAPNADPRDVVADIMSVNRLSSADIQPGEQLAIPAQYGH
jgi:ABC-type transport system involved in cytochrome c biogenesis permease component